MEDLQYKCREIRKDIIEMIYKAKSGHPGGSLSIVEILVSLYYNKMNIDPQSPKDENRDRFILSKGHAAPALYAVLADKGYFEKSELKTFRQLGSKLQGHPDMKKLRGVDFSTGSLGQGVSVATGIALGAKAKNKTFNVYALLGDGELQEGIVWESAMAAAHYGLDNLTIIIDNNGLQIDGTNDQVMGLLDIEEKYKSFGFTTYVVDGNSLEQLDEAFNAEFNKNPKCIITKTIKGKGVSFMQDNVAYHGKSLNEDEYNQAVYELSEVQ